MIEDSCLGPGNIQFEVLTFDVTVKGKSREEILDKRDVIVDALKDKGFSTTATVDGTYIMLRED